LLSLSAIVNTESGLLENCLTLEQRNVKMQATRATPKYRIVYRWRTADEVKAEEKKTYLERRASLLPLTKCYEQVLVPQHLAAIKHKEQNIATIVFFIVKVMKLLCFML
jgi:hypothetical protein